MSLLRSQSPSNQCACKGKSPVGSMRLRIVPVEVDVRDAPKHDSIKQLLHAEKVQNLFFPTMTNVDAHEHNEGLHMHPEQPSKVAHISQLHDQMEQAGLVARLSVQPGGDHTSVSVPLTRQHVSDLVANGHVDLAVPYSSAQIRLHSATEGRITGMEYKH